MMSNDEFDSERAAARLSLLLDAPEPAPGPKPGIDELWDWQAGLIDGERAEQIRAHVARDPSVYAQWREIRLAIDEPSPKESPATAETAQTGPLGRLVGWLFPEGFAGGAMAAAAVIGVAVVVGIQLFGAPELDEIVDERYAAWGGFDADLDPWSADGIMIKGNQVGVVRERSEVTGANAFAFGMSEGLRMAGSPVVTGPGGETLPTTLPACDAGDAGCPDYVEAMRQLGRLVTGAHLQCRRDGSPGLSSDDLEPFIDALDVAPAAWIRPVVVNLERDVATAVACARVEAVLVRAMSRVR